MITVASSPVHDENGAFAPRTVAALPEQLAPHSGDAKRDPLPPGLHALPFLGRRAGCAGRLISGMRTTADGRDDQADQETGSLLHHQGAIYLFKNADKAIR